MSKKNPVGEEKASPVWAELDGFIREQIQARFQALLEAEVTEWLGRPKSARRAPEEVGYRNGHGKPRRLTVGSGTISVDPGRRDEFLEQVLPITVAGRSEPGHHGQ